MDRKKSIKHATGPCNFLIALSSTTRKEFEIVSGNIEMLVTCTIQRSRSNRSDDACFMSYDPSMITKRDIDSLSIVKKDLLDGAILAFSISIDAATVTDIIC